MKFHIPETQSFDFKKSEPKFKFGTSEQDTNADDIPLWTILAVEFDADDLYGTGETEVKFTLASKTAPPVFGRNQPIKFVGAVASPYSMNGKAGISYRATAVAAFTPTAAPMRAES